ncbi:hypothetical protein PHYPO_G00073910 [Pangasianodon hypophthalmus]|uniref:Death domain-containing protein n=1 Tax=Pangasianodon hypophthalmus TaxID=310915 RepID=A0A5N5LV46_PANHP|nr:uncharacterized protein zgc:174906 [Pangasianodon hypophthalmus]XP_053096429.1 uncharacterized protein zgc:174906 [Pangasianodon hypophthalmus]KAB5546598.1 hypothetical protein PHYPO_G00073910 [Pangasianodon hypophthalmus]
MAVEPAGGARLIQKFKLRLIDALCGDPDFLLQHCHSSRLLTQKEYDRIKASAVPWDKARDILDYMMSKDKNRVQIFLSLLKEKDIQEAFPKLEFLKELPLSQSIATGKKRKNGKEKQPEEEVPRKQPHKVKKRSRTVTEKQLMKVARHIGTDWKEVGRVALEISSVKLEQIVEENPHSHRERVFSMLRLWSMREKELASATRLHSLLTQEEFAVTPGSIDFLLEES